MTAAQGDWVAFPAVPPRAKEAQAPERRSRWRFVGWYLGAAFGTAGVSALVALTTGIELTRLHLSVGAGIVLLAVWLVLRRQPDPTRRIRSDGSAWTVGDREAAGDDVRRVAQVEVPRRGGEPELWLRFGVDRHLDGIVLLRAEGRPVLDAAQRDALLALLERAPVELPPALNDPYDPKGRFSYLDRPNHLDRDAALELVREPPVRGLGRRPDQRAGG